MRKRLRTSLALCLALFVAGCDPRQAIEKIFVDQGLHLLTPLRTYVEVGGLVVVPKSGAPFYVDRTDTIPSSAEDKPIVDFDAVLAGETRGQTAKLGVASSALQKLTGVPISFSIDSSQDVELGQIAATGKRLKIPSVQSLIQVGGTNKQIKQGLSEGGRVFVVYEVYRSNALTMRGVGGTALNVGLAVGETSGSKPAAGAAGEASRGTGGAGATAPSTSPAQPSATGGGRNSPSATAAVSPKPSQGIPDAGAECPAMSSSSSPSAGASAGSDNSVTAHWKRTKTFELALCGDNAYPFAVRLAEVVTTNGLLQLRPGSFKFKGSLGGTDEEKFTARVNTQAELSLQRKSLK